MTTKDRMVEAIAATYFRYCTRREWPPDGCDIAALVFLDPARTGLNAAAAVLLADLPTMQDGNGVVWVALDSVKGLLRG